MTRFLLGSGLVAIVVAGLSFAVWRGVEALRLPEPGPIEDFSAPFVYGRFSVPADNPLTQEAFELGRHLFYDPILSGSNQMSCASCHEQAKGFTDGLAQSLGADGEPLDFNAMSLVNLLWGPQRFFWDGRSESLEQQVLEPLLNPREMDQPLDELVQELRGSADYRKMFRRAYGEVSEEAVAKALATFLRTLISSNSKYDQYLRGETRLSETEELGRKLFMAHPDVSVSLRGGNCIDCHSQFLTAGFADGWDGFMNNGLDVDADLKPGLFAVTGDEQDRGKFKVPSLRNIAVTGPYMHDGRFDTLEEVMAHYNEHIRVSATLSPLILEADNASENPTASQGLNLQTQEVEAILAFLQTLTDETFLTDPKFSSPFDESNTQ